MPKKFFNNMKSKIPKPKGKGRSLGFYNKGPNSYYGNETNSKPISINHKLDMKTKLSTANGRIKPNPTRKRKLQRKGISPNISDGKQIKDVLYMTGVVSSMLNADSKINPIKLLRKLKK